MRNSWQHIRSAALILARASVALIPPAMSKLTARHWAALELPWNRSEPVDHARENVLIYATFPREHWSQIAGINLRERRSSETGRHEDVVGIFSNAAAIARSAGALMLGQNAEWGASRPCMSFEGLAVSSDARASTCQAWRPDLGDLAEDRCCCSMPWSASVCRLTQDADDD